MENSRKDVQIPPLLSKEHPRNKWDDEDDVKESWEDEDEPAPAPVVKPPPEKPPKKSTAKTTEKKGKTVEVVKEEKLDTLAEKLCQQRLVEETDFRFTTELFAKKGDEKSLDSFIPKSENDSWNIQNLFLINFAQLRCESYHYNGLLKAIMRPSMTGMKAADANEVSASVTGKKKQLHVDKPEDDLVVNPYDTLDDYDFMKSVSVIGITFLGSACFGNRHYITP
ncbi:eukaryotic translation initiation factor [Salix suchowensis]|nr:eukaryotic translation initiation factor [Salix suchowensis]